MYFNRPDGTKARIEDCIKMCSDAGYRVMDMYFLDCTNFDTPFRYIISGIYLVFYQINNETVEILRVIYARRDYIKILFNIDCEKIEESSENAPE